VLGAFVAGVLVGESPILTSRIEERLRGLISSLFMPVFFGLAGVSADLTVLRDPTLLLLTGALILIASFGKFGGAFLGGALGGLSGRESMALASGMNARGSTEVIIATIGLSIGMLSQDMFTMIVTMAIVTTMAMPPMLRATLARVPMGKEEKARLEREETEEKGFVSNLERLLLAVDESVNAKFAATIAGLVAGARGLPITVLHIGAKALSQEKNKDDEESAENTVRNAAKAIAELDEENASGDVDITTRSRRARPKDAVADEARKGFDLLVVGMDKVTGAKGGYDKKIEEVTKGFEGPIALVAAKGKHLDQPASNVFRVLVPVSGSGVSRRGAEVALVLSRASPAPMQVIYVSTTRDRDSRRAASRSLMHEKAILEDIGVLASRYDVAIHSIMHTNMSPDQAILQEIRDNNVDLVVMGVDRVKGDSLNFGGVAAVVLEKSKVSVLLVSSGDSESKHTGAAD
jgi:nucleotide-binding universal stress UspA family protein